MTAARSTHGRHRRVEQDLADLGAGAQMRRQSRPAHRPGSARPGRRCADARRAGRARRRCGRRVRSVSSKSAAAAQGVHQVVGDVDAASSARRDRLRIGRIGLDAYHLGSGPRVVAQPVRRAGSCTARGARRRGVRDQPAADVAGRACDQATRPALIVPHKASLPRPPSATPDAAQANADGTINVAFTMPRRFCLSLRRAALYPPLVRPHASRFEFTQPTDLVAQRRPKLGVLPNWAAANPCRRIARQISGWVTPMLCG